jgi:phosphotransferase system enzyme I (PtsI)
MAVNAIPAVGVQLGKVTLETCQEVAAQVVASRNSRDAKELAAKLLG